MLSFSKKIARKLLRAPATALVDVAAAVTARQLVAPETAQTLFGRRGYHLLRDSYYLPIPEASDVGGDFWESQSELVGLVIDHEAALRLVEDDLAPFISEFRASFPLHATADASSFHLLNGMFMAVDAHVYYSLIRFSKPRRVLEIGAGWSTVAASEAVMRNRAEGRATELVAIEPYPEALRTRKLPGLSRLVATKVQEVPLSEFTSLESGDILFIDSSHVLKAGGDVQYEFLEILPRLKPGVYVHVHDISLPKQYPKTYYERNLYWNEQYLLQAFLAFNTRFEVVWPGNFVMVKSPARLLKAIPEISDMRKVYPSSEPASFWMRTRQTVA